MIHFLVKCAISNVYTWSDVLLIGEYKAHSRLVTHIIDVTLLLIGKRRKLIVIIEEPHTYTQKYTNPRSILRRD